MAREREIHPFWRAQCPERGPALTHVHAADCDEGHLADQCCECGHRASMQATPNVVRLAPPMPERRDDVLVEPRYATHRLPDRPGWGRGPLTERDKRRVLFFLGIRGGRLGE